MRQHCHRAGLLPKPVLIYCQLDDKGQLWLVTFESQHNQFLSENAFEIIVCKMSAIYSNLLNECDNTMLSIPLSNQIYLMNSPCFTYHRALCKSMIDKQPFLSVFRYQIIFTASTYMVWPWNFLEITICPSEVTHVLRGLNNWSTYTLGINDISYVHIQEHIGIW